MGKKGAGTESWAKRSAEVLRRGGTILYPTDTIWGIGCDATNAEAVARIYSLKQRGESKALLALVDSVEMLRRFVNPIPDAAYPFLQAAGRPTTIVYPHAFGLAPNLPAPDGSVGIRIVKHALCERIIALLGRPIVSTSANLSGFPSDGTLQAVPASIRSGVDLELPERFGACKSGQSSRVIRLDGTPAGYTVLRG